MFVPQKIVTRKNLVHDALETTSNGYGINTNTNNDDRGMSNESMESLDP